ncbi:MAG: hypothetical protein U1E65_31480 [Myxococcota bacterium]
MDLRSLPCALALWLVGCGHAVTSPGTVSFELENQGAAPIFAQVSVSCGGQAWVSIIEPNGTIVGTQGGSCMTRCGEPPIACPAVCLAPMTASIGHGQVQTETWDAIIYRQSGSCVSPEAADLSATYHAKFCWGTGTSTAGDGSPKITGQVCGMEDFKAGGEVHVRHVVQ